MTRLGVFLLCVSIWVTIDALFWMAGLGFTVRDTVYMGVGGGVMLWLHSMHPK